MEDSKMDRFKSGTKRLFGRTNERLKQKMGRSSETVITKDDKWQVLVANFNRQQTAAFRLHREVKGYIASLKTMESSTQTLLDAVREMHEYTWPGNMSLVKALQGLDKLNKELNEVMLDSLLVPVNNYVEIFPQIRERMSKRERKLLDYTRSKRTLDSLKKGEKISPEKLGLAQDNYTENKMIYEEVNNELCDDLPQLWESRKTYILKFLDTFFRQSADFHKEFTQVFGECSLSLDPLKEQTRNEAPPKRDIGNVDKFFLVSDSARRFKRQSLRKSVRKSGGSFKRSLSMGAIKKKKVDSKDNPQSMSNLSVDPYTVPAQQANVYSPTKAIAATKSSPQRPKPPRSTEPAAILDSEPGAPFPPSIKVEPGTKVECIHVYKAVDEDELSFEAGDVVTVLDWDSTDEQDEGWFMGILEASGAKGAFPINYTRRFSNTILEEEEWHPINISGPTIVRINGEYQNIPEDEEINFANKPSINDEMIGFDGTDRAASADDIGTDEAASAKDIGTDGGDGTDDIRIDGADGTDDISSDDAAGADDFGINGVVGTDDIGIDDAAGTDDISIDDAAGADDFGIDEAVGADDFGTDEAAGADDFGIDEAAGANDIGIDGAAGADDIGIDEAAGASDNAPISGDDFVNNNDDEPILNKSFDNVELGSVDTPLSSGVDGSDGFVEVENLAAAEPLQ